AEVSATPLLLALALAGPAADPGPASRLSVGILTDPVSLDPHQATDVVSVVIVGNVCETLVRFDTVHPAPALATSWATLDGRDWTLTLRPGVRFHDGQPFDADAVVANLERLRQVRGVPRHGQPIRPHLLCLILPRPDPPPPATPCPPLFALRVPAPRGQPPPP